MQLLQQWRTPARRRGGNGGFPDPPAGEPVRVLTRRHRSCGAETRIRIPASLPETAVQRVLCEGCHRSYEPGARASAFDAAPAAPPAALTAAVFTETPGAARSAEPGAPESPEEQAPALPPTPAPGGSPSILAQVADSAYALRDRCLDWIDELRDRTGQSPEQRPGANRRSVRLRAWALMPLALIGVLIGLSLIQGDSGAPPPPATPIDASAAAAAKFIEQPGFSLALPAGWSKANPPAGAVFAARSEDGTADATLWIEEEPGLSMRKFERRSLEQLGEIGDNPRVVDRVDAPTLEGTIIELRAETPVAGGVTAPYRVTLRGAGDFRHYLASSQRPGAEPGIAADIELLHGSLRPEVELAGLDSGRGG